MKIAGLLVWVLTAGIGIYLLAAGIAAQREAAGLRRPARAGPAGGGGAPAGGGGGPAGGRGGGASADGGTEALPGEPADGLAMASPGEPADSLTMASPSQPADPLAPGPDGATVVGAAALASITAPGGTPAPGSGGPEAEGSPLLEFMHPLLALTGLTFWIFFVMTDDRLFAWIAFGVVAATVLAGLSWAALTRRTARQAARRTGPEPAGAGATPFPAHLLVIHGLAAASTVTLVVISAITAAHG